MSDKYTTAGRWVVGTDGSLRADKAVMWAAKYVSQRTIPVPLLIIHAIVESPVPAEARQDAIKDSVEKDPTRVAAERILQGVAAGVREAYPDLVIETAVVRGQPAHILAEAAADADQVVVGARGKGAPVLVRLTGGTSDHVVAHAQGSVAVVPDQAEEHEGGPVVLGVDDSPQGQLAIGRAFQAASLRGVPLVAVRAGGSARGAGRGDGSALAIDEGKRMIAAKVAEFPGLQVTVEGPQGPPEDALIEASRTAGLVVMGSGGFGGVTGLRLGPTTRHVLRETRCPVVVARAEAGWKDQKGRPTGVAAH